MEDISSAELMAICDDYWAALAAADPLEEADTSRWHRRHKRYATAVNELARRGPEIRDWCRRLLTHPEYDAREEGAFLLGQLGRRGQLGEAAEAVVAELGALTRRPVEVDCKELQAVDSAVRALAEIGLPSAVLHLTTVLFSDNKDLTGDSQWTAADALGRLVGQPFMTTSDPLRAARAWLSAQPDFGEGRG